MRRIHSSAVRVSCIALACALVPAPALAAGADFYLKIEGVDDGSKTDRHKPKIEILSYSWGVTQMGGGHGGGSGAGKVNMQDISVMRGPRQSTSLEGTYVTADDDGVRLAGPGTFNPRVKAPRDVATGMASGKRQHWPVKIAKPLDTGSITMAMKLAGCTVGTRYPSAELTTPGGRYALRDLVVASCEGPGGGGGGGAGGSAPMEQVTLNYAKVEVRGWDTKQKEK